jgi:putative radical SAM enzyme (TIGR03279 family)
MSNSKGVEIETVRPGFEAEALGFRPGDVIVSIGDNTVRDIIDVLYYGSEPTATAKIRRGKRVLNIELKGLTERDNIFTGQMTFRPFKVMTCKNNCLFCFVSQLPKGLRKSLYVKDEDYRLSFLYGSYITLTNLTEQDKQRIITQRLSPLYISVHATDQDKRIQMLGNPNAPTILDEIRYLARHRIRMHTQIVVCPGINDGSTLERTIKDLYRFYPYVMSIAVVPVGLTAHRRRKLKGFDKALAIDTLRIVEGLQRRFRKRHGEGIVYAADELYIKANRPFPDLSQYDELPQLENGVGMVPLFMHRAKELKIKRYLSGLPTSRVKRIVTFTGTSFYPFLKEYISRLQDYGINIEVHQVINNLLGESVTVAGLISGRDVIKTLTEQPIEGATLLIPEVCLKEGEGLFLDDVTVQDIEEILKVRAIVIPSTPKGLIEGVLQAYTPNQPAPTHPTNPPPPTQPTRPHPPNQPAPTHPTNPPPPNQPTRPHPPDQHHPHPSDRDRPKFRFRNSKTVPSPLMGEGEGEG